MLRLALLLFIIAIIAAAFGFFPLAGAMLEVGKIIFFIFVVLAILALIGGLAWRTPPPV
jgi:uncharacterized membrane protein YtjA (UPF0391 family)